MSAEKRLAAHKRIVFKIGSALLVDRKSGLKSDWLNSIADDVAMLRAAGHEVLIVSSGAIALGRGLLGLKSGALKLEESQAAAAAGQIGLSRAYHDALGGHGIRAAQILLTLGDTEERRRYLNARATIETLLKLGAVPIINENDTVATSEIRYGDNDRLAARVATMMTCDLLILLSDIDGLYTAPPALDPDATFIAEVEAITPEIEAMAGDAGTELSRGGMVTKIEAGKIATAGGTTMVITSGKRLHPVRAIAEGGRATWFKASGSPVTSRKKWIAGQLSTSGRLHLDAGAERALLSGKSLLPAGIRQVSGMFNRGDVVSLVNAAGIEIGRGLVAYDSNQAQAICGLKSAEIEARLGFAGRSEMVHRDDLALRPGEGHGDGPGDNTGGETDKR
ncbi:MAG: glutamate 5-kinase [Nitratireductor sp.]|nr:glutamate 5-kinase [Nitratireductor sp.]